MLPKLRLMKGATPMNLSFAVKAGNQKKEPGLFI